jgi:hypothetical protein
MLHLNYSSTECINIFNLKRCNWRNVYADFDKTPISEFLDMFLRHHVIHACRQRNEVHDAAEQLKSSGLPVQLLPAIETLFETTCESIKKTST